MSQITQIYNALDNAIALALPDHDELIHPYLPELDSNLSLDKAYGFTISDGINTLLNDRSGYETITRNFELLLTRRKFATKGDIATRKTTEKALLEDMYEVMKAIREDQTLQQSGITVSARYDSDPGAELLSPERRNDIFAIRMLIAVEYNETYQLCF